MWLLRRDGKEGAWKLQSFTFLTLFRIETNENQRGFLWYDPCRAPLQKRPGSVCPDVALFGCFVVVAWLDETMPAQLHLASVGKAAGDWKHGVICSVSIAHTLRQDLVSWKNHRGPTRGKPWRGDWTCSAQAAYQGGLWGTPSCSIRYSLGPGTLVQLVKEKRRGN